MKLRVLINVPTSDQICKSKILSQLIPAVEKFGESMSLDTMAQLLQIDMDAESEIEEPNYSSIKIGRMEINIDRQSVSLNNVETTMTPMEFKLLHILAKRQGVVQSRANLLKDVWNVNPESNTRTLDVHIKRIRDKLGPNIIQTVSGVGYVIRD